MLTCRESLTQNHTNKGLAGWSGPCSFARESSRMERNLARLSNGPESGRSFLARNRRALPRRWADAHDHSMSYQR